MFRTLIYPSSGACDCVDELPHRSSCSQFFVCWSLCCAWYLVVFVLQAEAQLFRSCGIDTLKMGTSCTAIPEGTSDLSHQKQRSLVRVYVDVGIEQVKVARNFIGLNCLEDKLEEGKSDSPLTATHLGLHAGKGRCQRCKIFKWADKFCLHCNIFLFTLDISG